jgi:preprotein translocase subunit YajC
MAAGIVILIGFGYFVYSRKSIKSEEQHVELLDQYYDDEFQSSPRPQ